MDCRPPVAVDIQPEAVAGIRTVTAADRGPRSAPASPQSAPETPSRPYDQQSAEEEGRDLDKAQGAAGEDAEVVAGYVELGARERLA